MSVSDAYLCNANSAYAVVARHGALNVVQKVIYVAVYLLRERDELPVLEVKEQEAKMVR